MRKYILFLLSGCLLHLAVKAQEEDEALVKLANERIPVSMQHFSFFETYGTFIGRQLDFRMDTLSALQFRVRFQRNYKDIESVSMIFSAPEEGYLNSAKVTAMYIRFKTPTACAAYLKLLGKPATATRWDFDPGGGSACKGVQVFRQDEKTVRIQTFSDCSG
ncbi:MAG: hypothetical protein J0M10_04950 [Chitinophagales bacterium]|nr:hypothetical protein [Chitinophagales bacterium]